MESRSSPAEEIFLQTAEKYSNLWGEVGDLLKDSLAYSFATKIQLLKEPRRTVCQHEMMGVLTKHIVEQAAEQSVTKCHVYCGGVIDGSKVASSNYSLFIIRILNSMVVRRSLLLLNQFLLYRYYRVEITTQKKKVKLLQLYFWLIHVFLMLKTMPLAVPLNDILLFNAKSHVIRRSQCSVQVHNM